MEEIPTSYGEKRVLDCLLSEGCCSSSLALYDEFPFIWDSEEPNYLQEIDARLWRIKPYMKRKCEDFCRYYKQEPKLIHVIQRVAGRLPYEYFECGNLLSDSFNSEFLALCVSIQSSIKASREFSSSPPLELCDCVVLSPDGKLIAVRDPPFPKREGDTIKVFMKLMGTVDSVSFSDPVHVIKQLRRLLSLATVILLFTSKKKIDVSRRSLFRLDRFCHVTQDSAQCLTSYSLRKLGLFFVREVRKVSSLLLLFFVSSAFRKYLVLPVITSTGSPSGITFTLGGNISYLSSCLMLTVVIRSGDGSFVTSAKCAPLECPHGCKVENCALSRQGNSIAVSQKANILLFDNHEFHRTVFEKSEDIECQVSCLIFSNDGTLLLYCVERRNSKAEVCLWNVDQEQLSSSFIASQLESINCCCLSPDNSMVILCGELRVEIGGGGVFCVPMKA